MDKIDLTDVRRIHFIGIGGVSMSKLAAFYLGEGYEVSGSDRSDTRILKDLRKLGAEVYAGSRPDISASADLVVYSSAISEADIEMNNAFKAERKQLLTEYSSRFGNVITVSGAHGKTTASAIIAHILEAAGLNPTAHIGGEVIGRDPLKIGGRGTLVIEGCEYKRSFLEIETDCAVVLNVDYDHPDTYRNIDEVYEAFANFVHGADAKFIEYSHFARLEELSLGLFRESLDDAVTFGASGRADYYYANVASDNGIVSFDVYKRGEFYLSARVHSINAVIVKSAIAAIAVADSLGAEKSVVLRALETFGGVSRRGECLGRAVGGARVITDYAHHPGEIKELIKNVRTALKKRVIAVFEPHTYSRTKALADEFVEALALADVRIILPTYPARETPSDGMDGIELAYLFRRSGLMSVYSEYGGLKELLSGYGEGDLILLIGAGIRYQEIYAKIAEPCSE